MKQLLIEIPGGEYEVVTEDELREMEKQAMEFDGFFGWRVVGYCDSLVSAGNMPETFYSGLNASMRLKMLVDHWQRAIKVNQELEEQLKDYEPIK